MKRILSALAISAAMLVGAPAFAEDAAANPVVQAEAKSTLTTANAMINYGRAHKDALAMIAGVPIESAGKPMDLSAVLDEAVALAGDDALIKAKADSLRDEAETKSRGACYWEYWCDWYGYCEYWYVCY